MCKVEFNLMWLSIWNLQVTISSLYRWTKWNEKASDHSHRVIKFKMYEIDQIWCSPLGQFEVQANLTSICCAGNYTFGNYKRDKQNFLYWAPRFLSSEHKMSGTVRSCVRGFFQTANLQFSIKKKNKKTLYRREHWDVSISRSSSYISVNSTVHIGRWGGGILAN